MKWQIVTLVVWVGGLLLAQCATASDGNPGREAYFRYCASCHGEDARGHGEVARSMRLKPPDLTQLARKHHGTFPDSQIKDAIDGRKRIAAHGSTKMPVWGQVFSQEQTYEPAEAHARSQVRLLVDYLRSIQAD